ncbi:MAG: hypothetical protein IPP48_05695 [Chitinophagaceae bacterium]|nr:hypothetical protein [Chitinophagaceae bacterium]
MIQQIVIIGASNAFWEIDELIKDINAVSAKYEIVGVYDDDKSLWGKQFNNLVVQGPIQEVKTYLRILNLFLQ